MGGELAVFFARSNFCNVEESKSETILTETGAEEPNGFRVYKNKELEFRGVDRNVWRVWPGNWQCSSLAGTSAR